ncbi:hypothetical protein [Labrys wisconsinensis]|uniref:Uncharacterized protein n=1 Tax=Labrys wisconsinensis TaxID=425677 RepID=A0ABU0JLB1_9HYPH|nr:hypothetical protein [Labrys wisconsinensis]MDQ0475074.1 hypothetical protein [Labrys wisconsinensis]
MMTVERALIAAILKYNRNQLDKASYSPTALGTYLIKLDKALSAVERGEVLDEALAAQYGGALLTALQKAAKPFKPGEKTVERALLKAMLKYNKDQASKASYNPASLAKHLSKLDKALGDVDGGVAFSAALSGRFSDGPLDVLLKAVRPYERTEKTVERAFIKAIVDYNKTQADKASYNPSFLDTYVVKLDKVLSEVGRGSSFDKALSNKYSGPLLDSLLEAAKPFQRAAQQ